MTLSAQKSYRRQPSISTSDMRLHEGQVAKLLGGFSLFALVYYGYLYFYDFHEGVSSAPFAVKAFKDAIYIFVAILLGVIVAKSKPSPINYKTSLIFAPLAVALLATSLIHAPQTGLAEQLWENVKNVVIFIPMFSLPFFLSTVTCQNIRRMLFRVILLAAAIQCVFVSVYHGLGGRLWLDGIQAGLVGNPNSFGLFLNLTAAVILAYFGSLNGFRLVLALLALAAITGFLLGTTSGSQLIIFCGLVALSFVFRPQQWKALSMAALTCVCVVFLERSKFADSLFAFQGGGAVFGGESGFLGFGGRMQATMESAPASLSITNRIIDITDALSVLKGDFLTILFGSFENTAFRPMDGQPWVFLYNSGLIGLLTFAGAAAFVYLRSAAHAWKMQNNYALALHLMITAFGVTFLASRVLMYFPFNFLFFLIAGLSVTLSARESLDNSVDQSSARR